MKHCNNNAFSKKHDFPHCYGVVTQERITGILQLTTSGLHVSEGGFVSKAEELRRIRSFQCLHTFYSIISFSFIFDILNSACILVFVLRVFFNIYIPRKYFLFN